MDGEANDPQPKQERLRTRWTASLDKIFADLVVEQIQLGNRPNNVFDKKAWNHIRDEFNKRTELNFNNNQLRKHLDVLRTRYYSVKSAFDQNEFVIDDSCCIGFDMWDDGIGAQTKPETTKVKECPIFEQLCTIFADSGADGKYAQSSHYDELDKSLGTDTLLINSYPESGTPRAKTPASSSFGLGNAISALNGNKSMVERKRKRSSDVGSVPGQTKRDQEINETMSKAMLDMLDASKVRAVSMSKQNERFTITNCVKVLDETEAEEGMDSYLYFTALDLFEDPNLRETFVSLKSNNIRLAWLQGKCGNATPNLT